MQAIPTREAHIVLAAARLLLPVREIKGKNNYGRFVETIQRYGGGVPGQPWCAYFVYYVGHGMLGSEWPMVKTGSCDELLDWATKNSILYDRSDIGKGLEMKPGLLFLVMKEKNDATHVGFVEEILPDGRFTTIEGNSTDRGIRDGDGVVSNTRDPRGLTWYKFIDWESML